jgi:branched-chain amino acid transport system substrate-binding protein
MDRRTPKRIFRAALLVALLAFGASCTNSEQDSASQKERGAVEVGVITPLTGKLSFLGQRTRRGLEIAKEEINSSGGVEGDSVKLIYADTRSTPRDAVNAANKLINVNDVPAIIGDITSSATLAVAPVAERNQVVLLANGASAPKVRDAGDYIFRNWNSDSLMAGKIANFAANQLNHERVGILYAQDDYGLGLKDAFEDHFEDAGGQVPIASTYQTGSKDFRTIIQKFPRNLDAIYLAGYPEDLGHFVRQSQELSREKPYLSTIGVQSEDFLSIAGEAANGIIYTAPSFNMETASGVMQDFIDKFEQKYGERPEVASAVSYDALKIMAKAIEEGGYSADSIKQALYKIQDFPGASGVTTFDDHGDVSKPVNIKTIREGEFVIYESPAREEQPS